MACQSSTPCVCLKHKMHGRSDRTNSLCRCSSNLRCASFDPAGAPLTSLVAHLHSRQPERSTQVRDTNCCTRHVSTAVASFAQSVSPADPPVRIQFRTSLTWLPQPWHGFPHTCRQLTLLSCTSDGVFDSSLPFLCVCVCLQRCMVSLRPATRCLRSTWAAASSQQCLSWTIR